MGRLTGRWAVRGAAMAAALAWVVPVATKAALASDAELVTGGLFRQILQRIERLGWHPT